MYENDYKKFNNELKEIEKKKAEMITPVKKRFIIY